MHKESVVVTERLAKEKSKYVSISRWDGCGALVRLFRKQVYLLPVSIIIY